METGDEPFAEISAKIIGLNLTYKSVNTNQWTFSPQAMAPYKPQIDPEQIHVLFKIARESVDPLISSQRSGTIIMKKEDITRMNLMVGDTIILKVTKAPNQPGTKDI